MVFGAPVTFSPEVEEHLSQLPDSSFQLLADAAQLPRRLTQLARPEIDLPEANLIEWANNLTTDDDSQPEPAASAGPPIAEPAPAPSFLRRAWSWLGADDIPHDTPYGHPAAQAAASSAEKQRLEQLQRDAQAQLQQQLQALEAREAERERRMEELRTELAQAPPVTTEAQTLRDRLAVESREKAVLEESIRASRAESDRRNRDLDAKIQQLDHLIEQLNNRPTGPFSGRPRHSAPPPTPAACRRRGGGGRPVGCGGVERQSNGPHIIYSHAGQGSAPVSSGEPPRRRDRHDHKPGADSSAVPRASGPRKPSQWPPE